MPRVWKAHYIWTNAELICQRTFFVKSEQIECGPKKSSTSKITQVYKFDLKGYYGHYLAQAAAVKIMPPQTCWSWVGSKTPCSDNLKHNQPINQPTNHSTYQPTIQPTNQPTEGREVPCPPQPLHPNTSSSLPQVAMLLFPSPKVEVSTLEDMPPPPKADAKMLSQRNITKGGYQDGWTKMVTPVLTLPETKIYIAPEHRHPQ